MIVCFSIYSCKDVWTYITVVDQVKWFRDRADQDRFREEVEILEAEFEQTIKSVMQMLDVWSQLASGETSPGIAAYTQRKAMMYRSLVEECKHAYAVHQKRAGCTSLD